MKCILLVFIFYAQSGLPFENDHITKEKIMAGIFGLAVYFIPTIIAREKRNFKNIFLVNLLIGWTFFGWFVALLWALKEKNKNPESIDLD